MTTTGMIATTVAERARPEPHWAIGEDGVELALTRFTADSNSGIPLLLTHGTFSNGSICWRLAAYLAGYGFDCWVLELRGRGNGIIVAPPQLRDPASLAPAVELGNQPGPIRGRGARQ